jgi:hypothetical protein
MEYGFSCMGYEIAGAIGIKMARTRPRRDLHGGRRQLHDGQFRTGDGRDDGRAFHRRASPTTAAIGCINRLQMAPAGPSSTTCWTMRGT